MSLKCKLFIALMLVLGIGFLLYPTVANRWNEYRQSQVVALYKEQVEKGEDSDGMIKGVAGIVIIPKIDVELPIYQGCSDEELQNGVGLLKNHDKLFMGKDTHAVLAGHRGLPSAELFTRLDELEEGDSFSVQVGKEERTYQVDQIIPMIDKDDIEGIEKALEPVKGKECITLFTCTPYGVNTHRLLVRGSAV